MGGKRTYDEDDEHRPEGNWLGKTRHNITMTARGWGLVHKLCLEYGLNYSEIIELAVREKYIKDVGPLPPIQYSDGRKANGAK